MPPLAKNMMVDDIVMTVRHRKDMGDLQELADSIEAEGLLQPIGVNLDNSLVFGERRLLACRDILGWDRLPAVIVHVTSMVAGEYAENEVRKDFTKMERVAIGETMEAEMGERRGNPDLKPDEPITDNCPELQKGQETRDIVAKKVGFGSGKEYERAKKVASKGSAELKAAVDSGEVAISKAAALTSLPKAEQTAAVKGGKKAVKKAAEKAARAKAPPVVAPTKKPSVADRLNKWLASITGVGETIRLQHKSVALMLRDKSWTPGNAQMTLGLVRALIKFLREFEKELTKYVNHKNT